jgi:type VI secretion system VasD/TssJ family lipoprotein
MKPIQLSLLFIALLLVQACSLMPWSKPQVQVTPPQTPTVSLVPNQPNQVIVTMPSPAPQAPVTDIAKLESSKVAYKKQDFTLLIKGDPQLNRFQNNSHTLFLCVYQLKDPNAFNQLAEEKDGLPKLLECSRFDGSVANAKRVSVQPGQTIKETRDRAEGARFIGIAAGYYGSGNQKVTDLAPLSVVNGDFSGNTIGIDLGTYEIDNVTVK